MSKGGKVKAIPAGYHNVTPYLIIDGAAGALDFYKRVFGATEKMRMPGPDGKIGHAEITIGDSMIMLADVGNDVPEVDADPVTRLDDVEEVGGQTTDLQYALARRYDEAQQAIDLQERRLGIDIVDQGPRPAIGLDRAPHYEARNRGERGLATLRDSIAQLNWIAIRHYVR